MSVDRLQSKIRKMKNPSMVAFCLDRSQIPESYLEAEPQVSMAYLRYAEDLLAALKDIVPAVRFAASLCFGSSFTSGAA